METPTAAQLRDEQTEIVLENAGEDWKDAAVKCIQKHWGGRQGIAEDFRLTCEENDIHPHHSNAWGALILMMKRQGLLISTGIWRAMTTKRSHARRSEVYQVC
jgi:hypothetical protein